MSLQGTIQDLRSSCHQKVTVGSVLDNARENAAGFLLLLSSLVILLPTSAVPGVTPFCAFIAFLAGLSVMMGWQTPKLPHRFRQLKLHPKVLRSLVRTLEHIDWVFFRRKKNVRAFRFFIRGLPLKIAGGISCLLAAITFALFFVPFLNVALMTPVALLGLGICARSGAIIASSVGVFVTSVSIASIFI